ncbi:hypothetical protein Tco_0414623 [Tanacetum coccineum]
MLLLESHLRLREVGSHGYSFEQSILSRRQIRDRAHTQRTDMTEQDIEASRARAEAIEQRAETLQVSLRVVRMDVRDLIKSCETDRFEMTELRNKVARNASNKRKWEGDHDGSSSKNKEHKVIRAHTAKPRNKKGYAVNLPLCIKCKFHHTGLCAENVAIASGLVIKLEIVGPQSREQSRGAQWQNRKPKLPIVSVEG